VNPGSARLDLSFASQNCNSLNMSSMKNQDMKINAIMEYKTDIIFLSDIRLNGKEKILFDKIRLNYRAYTNSKSRGRGVAVLISNQVEHEVLEQAVDPQENLILLKCKINGTEMGLKW